jgi:hypothetical protein
MHGRERRPPSGSGARMAHLQVLHGGSRGSNKFLRVDFSEVQLARSELTQAERDFYFHDLRISIRRSTAEPFYVAGFLIVDTTGWVKHSRARAIIHSLVDKRWIYRLDPVRSNRQRFLVGCVSGEGECYVGWLRTAWPKTRHAHGSSRAMRYARQILPQSLMVQGIEPIYVSSLYLVPKEITKTLRGTVATTPVLSTSTNGPALEGPAMPKVSKQYTVASGDQDRPHDAASPTDTAKRAALRKIAGLIQSHFHVLVPPFGRDQKLLSKLLDVYDVDELFKIAKLAHEWWRGSDKRFPFGAMTVFSFVRWRYSGPTEKQDPNERIAAIMTHCTQKDGTIDERKLSTAILMSGLLRHDLPASIPTEVLDRVFAQTGGAVRGESGTGS